MFDSIRRDVRLACGLGANRHRHVERPSDFQAEERRRRDADDDRLHLAGHGVNARLQSGTVWWLTVMGRLKPDVSVEQAAARLRTQSGEIFEATLPAAYPAASVK